jgi:hypothetical protein
MLQVVPGGFCEAGANVTPPRTLLVARLFKDATRQILTKRLSGANAGGVVSAAFVGGVQGRIRAL